MSHHLQYHSPPDERSWWCEKCLSQCSDLEPLDPLPAGHWTDFFAWLSELLIKGYGASLAAIFGLIMFIVGSGDCKPEFPSDERDVFVWETQLKWLEVRRHRILFGLAQTKSEFAHCYFHQDLNACDQLSRSIENLNRDLDDTMHKILELEKKLRRHYQILQKHYPEVTPEFFLAGQTNSQHEGH